MDHINLAFVYIYVAFVCALSFSEAYYKPKNQDRTNGKMIQEYAITQVHAERKPDTEKAVNLHLSLLN